MAEQRVQEPKGARRGSAVPIQETVRVPRRSRGRSYFALIMMVVLALASAGLAGYFIYAAGSNPYQAKAPGTTRPQDVASPAKGAISKKAVKMQAPKVTGFDRKERAYEINAEVARQDENEPHVVHMEKISANLRLKKTDDVVSVTSDAGTYDNESESLKLSGNILLTTTSGYAARLEQAEILMKDGKISTSRPLTISAPTGGIAANAMEMWNDGNNIRFFNRAKLLFKGSKKDQG